jgi:hypothetical protein
MGKKIFLCFVCVLLSYVSTAQKVYTGEYFIDTDPGLGNGVPLSSFTNFNDSTLNINISTSTLSPGDHYLFLRFKNTSGKWSQYEGRHFYVYPSQMASVSPSIVAAEYFIDSDPGVGNGTPFPSFSAFSNGTINLSAGMSTLTTGDHYLFARFKDSNGKWSHYEGRYFHVYHSSVAASSPSVVAGEYFFDNDPGLGNATPMPAFTAFSNATLNLAASSSSSFTSGAHNLFARYKDANGRWGHYEGRSFTVCAVVPVSNFTITNSCVGSSVTISNTSSNAATYSWDMNNDAITDYTTNSTSFSHLYSAAGNYTVRLTTTSTAGCTDTKTTQVSVYPNPTISVNSGSICAGKSFTIIPSGASSYTVSGNSLTVSPASTSSYSVIGTSSVGCVSSNTAIATVFVTNAPTISVNSGSMCIGKSFTIIPAGVSTYTISGGLAIVSPSINTSYSVTGTSSLGCIATNTAVSSITVYSLPIITVNSGTVCSGRSFTIIPTGATSYTINGGSTVVSPSINTSYSITGTSSVGCVSSNTAISSVTVLTSPVVSSNSGTICAGNPFIIIPNGAVTYSVTGNSFTVSPSLTSSYSVTGTNSLGCTSSNTAISTVTVHSLPLVSAASGSICSGKTYTINPSGAFNYSINGGSYIVSPVSTTSYSITGTSSVGCNSSSPAIVTVTVHNLPVVTVNSGSICTGLSFTLQPGGAATYSISGGSPVVNPINTSTYSVIGSSSVGCLSSNTAIATVTVQPLPTITVNSGTICAGNIFTLIPSGALTYTYSNGSPTIIATANASYSVTGTNSFGCSSGSPAVSNLTVFALPVITANSGSICAGQIFSINPSGAFTYSFSGGSPTVSPISTTSFSVSGSSPEGCTSALPAVVTISVNPIPILSVNSGSVCAGQTFTIIPAGAFTYTFSNGSSTVIPSANTTYSVSGTSSAGCVSASPAISSVSVIPLPVISVNSGTICSGEIFIITPTGGTTYTITGGSNTVSPVTNTAYSVTGADASGCISATPAISSVTVYPLPTLTISSTSSSTICAGESLTLTVQGATTYSWSSGPTNNILIASPVVTTTYSVVGFNNEGCKNNSTFQQSVDPCVGFSDINQNYKINIYPNPNNGRFNLSLEDITEIKIFNDLGQVVYYRKACAGKHEVNLSDVANGIYFVILKESNSYRMEKLIKTQ